MRRFTKCMAMLLTGMMVLTGCTSGGNTTSDTTTGGADAGEKLVVYSPQGDETRGAWIIEKAKKEIGVDIQFLCAGGGELSDRLIAEKSNPQADVILGLAQMAMYQLVREDVLTPYVPSWTKGLPEVYKEKDGYFHSFWQTPIVIAYNTDYITKEQAPKDWADLVKEDYQEKYAIGNSGGQTTRTYLAGFLWNYYEEASGEITQEGWDMLTKFYSNAGTMPANDADIWKAFKDGSLPILPWWYGGVKSNCEKNQIPVDYVVPTNGTPVVAEAVGIVKGTKKEEAAKKFIDWFGDPKTMASYANEFNQAPAHPDAIALCDDSVKKDASMFTAQNIDWGIVSEQMDSWLEKIELEIMQ